MLNVISTRLCWKELENKRTSLLCAYVHDFAEYNRESLENNVVNQRKVIPRHQSIMV